MTTTYDEVLQKQSTPPQGSGMPLIIPASIVWNLVLAVGSIALSVLIFGLESFGNLGRPVQVFVALIALVPAVLAVYSSVMLYLRKPAGRFSALVLQYVGLVLSVVLLLHLWGFFLGFESIIDGIMANATLTLGFALAYLIFWIGGRLDENNSWQDRLTQVALIIGAITLIVLLIASDVLAAANTILASYSMPVTWAATIAAVIFGFLAWRMLHMDAYFGETPQQRTAWQGWLMLSPNIIGFTLFFAGPLLLSFYLSFTDSSVGRVPQVTGLDNYVQLTSLEFQWKDDLEANNQSVMSFGFSPLGAVQLGDRALVVGARDVVFWISLRNTIMFCLLLVPLSTIPALVMSLILNSKLPGVQFFRAIYFLPSVAAVIGTALIWRWLYDPTIGFFNYIISQVTGFLGIADPEIAWLTDPSVVLISIVFLAAWGIVGFNTVLFLAGLQGIPKTLYEAAYVDGANGWQRFRNVTLPMLAPTTFFVIITTIITGLQVFNEPYALFPARPIPLEATTSVYYLFITGFNSFEFGYASAVAWLLFGLIFLVTFLQFRVQRSNAYDN